jgi:hypothetical protein
MPPLQLLPLLLVLASVVTGTHGGAAFVHSMYEAQPEELVVQGPSLSAAFQQFDFTDLRLHVRPLAEIRQTLWNLKLGKVPVIVAEWNRHGVSQDVITLFRQVLQSNIFTVPWYTLGLMHSPKYDARMRKAFAKLGPAPNFPPTLCGTTNHLQADLPGWYSKAIHEHHWRVPIPLQEYTRTIDDLKQYMARISRVRGRIVIRMLRGPSQDLYYIHELNRCLDDLELQLKPFYSSFITQLAAYIRRQAVCRSQFPAKRGLPRIV